MPAVATLTEAAPAVPAAPVLSSTPPQTPAAETVETPTQLLRESSEAAQQGAEVEVADLLEMPSGSVGSTESVPVVQPILESRARSHRLMRSCETRAPPSLRHRAEAPAASPVEIGRDASH